MTLVRLRRAFAAASIVALASCATGPQAYYAPPAGLTPDKAVSLLGSKDPKFFLQSSEYRLVWAVDGKQVKGSAYRWDQPLLITAAEPHRLSLAYGWGAVAGGLDVEFTGKPGTTVVVRGENVDPDTAARLWLEDAATGQILGEKHSVRLAYRSDPTLATSSPPADVIASQVLRGKF
jgi:hypothetical protein